MVNVIRVVQVRVVNDYGEVLWLKRHPNCKYNANKWTYPGGKIVEFENWKNTLVRELFEETGLLLNAFDFYDCTYFPGLEEDTVIVSLIFTTYKSKRVAIKLCDEHSEYKWSKEKPSE